MSLKLFDFTEQFMIETFLIKIKPIGENWINKYILYFAGTAEN